MAIEKHKHEFSLEGFQNRNREDFSYVYELYYDRLCFFSYNLVKIEMEAQDITTETFIKLYKSALNFESLNDTHPKRQCHQIFAAGTDQQRPYSQVVAFSAIFFKNIPENTLSKSSFLRYSNCMRKMSADFQHIERISLLIIKSYKGEIDDSEYQELMDWCALSENNLALYEKLTDPDYLIKSLREFSAIQSLKQASWVKLNAELFRTGNESKEGTRDRSPDGIH